MRNRRKVNNYGQIISENCRQKWKLFILKSQYKAGERWCNKFGQKATRYVHVASEVKIIPPPTTIAGQVDSES
jgi:hypothetical protein